MNLRELKRFLDEINLNESPYWESIFKSDMRNIFPKYQVCKIQLAKNEVSKIRFIMENINDFTQMEVEKSSLKESVASISQNISQELSQLLKQNKQKNIHYNFDICFKKDLSQKLVKQFSKPLQISLLKNAKCSQKWKQYITSHMESPNKINLDDLDQQRINIASTFPIMSSDFESEQNLLIQNQFSNQKFQFLQKYGVGYQGKVFQKRVKQKIMIQHLVNYLYSQKTQLQKQNQSDQRPILDQQFQQIRKFYQL